MVTSWWLRVWNKVKRLKCNWFEFTQIQGIEVYKDPWTVINIQTRPNSYYPLRITSDGWYEQIQLFQNVSLKSGNGCCAIEQWMGRVRLSHNTIGWYFVLFLTRLGLVWEIAMSKVADGRNAHCFLFRRLKFLCLLVPVSFQCVLGVWDV